MYCMQCEVLALAFLFKGETTGCIACLHCDTYMDAIKKSEILCRFLQVVTLH